eukprot:9308402-Pyramimonas_sp.AAC.1
MCESSPQLCELTPSAAELTPSAAELTPSAAESTPHRSCTCARPSTCGPSAELRLRAPVDMRPREKRARKEHTRKELALGGEGFTNGGGAGEPQPDPPPGVLRSRQLATEHAGDAELEAL